MSEDTVASKPSYLGHVADIVAAYVSKNSIPQAELPDLIASIDRALNQLTAGTPAMDAPNLAGAVDIRKSVKHEYLVSMIDGKHYKTLKRHLSTHGLTPEEYRDRYGLPRDYPMVAPAYSQRRIELAKQLGLGRRATALGLEKIKRTSPDSA